MLSVYWGKYDGNVPVNGDGETRTRIDGRWAVSHQSHCGCFHGYINGAVTSNGANAIGNVCHGPLASGFLWLGWWQVHETWSRVVQRAVASACFKTGSLRLLLQESGGQTTVLSRGGAQGYVEQRAAREPGEQLGAPRHRQPADPWSETHWQARLALHVARPGPCRRRPWVQARRATGTQYSPWLLLNNIIAIGLGSVSWSFFRRPQVSSRRPHSRLTGSSLQRRSQNGATLPDWCCPSLLALLSFVTFSSRGLFGFRAFSYSSPSSAPLQPPPQ